MAGGDRQIRLLFSRTRVKNSDITVPVNFPIQWENETMLRRGRKTKERIKEVETERERTSTSSPTRTPVDGRSAYRIKGIPLLLPK